jgi:hypothetical protein
MVHIMSTVPHTLVAAVEDDVDKGACASALSALTMMLQEMGPALLQPHLEALVKGATSVLKGEATCQVGGPLVCWRAGRARLGLFAADQAACSPRPRLPTSPTHRTRTHHTHTGTCAGC